MAAVERLLAHKARVVIPDPLGVWWGLRLDADGKTASGHDVVIFGGPHGDLPLTEHAGALIGARPTSSNGKISGHSCRRWSAARAWCGCRARGILATAQFPPKVTFDSSRTPKRGEHTRATAALKPLDLGKLKERLARVEAETKANDPRALRAEIVSLQNKLKNIPKNIPVDQVCLEAAERRGFEQAERKLRREAERYAQDTIVTAMDALDALIAPIGVRLKEQIAAAKKQRAALNVEFTAAARASPAIIAARPARPQSEPNGGGNLDRPLQTIINAIRWWNVLGVEAPSHAQAGPAGLPGTVILPINEPDHAVLS